MVEIDGLLRNAFESSHFINNFINVRNNAKNLNGYAPIEHIERGDLTALKRLKQYAKEMARNAEREQDELVVIFLSQQIKITLLSRHSSKLYSPIQFHHSR